MREITREGSTTAAPRPTGLETGRAGCRVCGRVAARELFPVHGVILRHCDECGAAFAPAEPTAHEAERLYDAGYFTGGVGHYRDYAGEEATHRRQARRYLRRIARAGYHGGRILDVGCAAGFFLDEARRAGWHTKGIEVSDYAARIARERFDLDVERAEFLDARLDGEQFDVVTFFNVFEHLSRPREIVRRLGEIVRQGGMVFIETWDAESLTARLLGPRWHQWDPRFVPYYYSLRALRLIFDAGNWRLKWWIPSAKWISFARACEIVAAGLEPGRGRRLLNRVASSTLGDVDLPYFAGDLVVAQLVRR